MKETTIPISASEYTTYAARAVNAIVSKLFIGFFSDEDVEDSVQDVVLAMLKNPDKYDPARGTIEQWVWTISRNVLFTAARRKKLHQDHIQPVDALECAALSGNEYQPDWDIRSREYLERLGGALRTERDQKIFFLLLDGYESDDIANACGLSKNVVYVAKSRLLSKVKHVA